VSCWVEGNNPKQKPAIKPAKLVGPTADIIKHISEKQPSVQLRLLKVLSKQILCPKALRPFSQQIQFYSQADSIAAKPENIIFGLQPT
jgi:hypothetical protein